MNYQQKKIRLRDGTEILLRTLEKTDGNALLEFFRQLPEEDRLFLRDDVTKEETINRWVTEIDFDKVLPILALHKDKIVGDATLHFNKIGWARHLAELRCVVAREFQKKGLGTALMRELVACAQQRGVEKIVAQMMDTQIGAQKAFQKLGFIKEAELHGFVSDLCGIKHNLIIMVNDVNELWKKMEDLLLDYDVKFQE